MKFYLSICIVFAIALGCGCRQEDPMEKPTPETEYKIPGKTNTMKLYMHYMPWFHSKEFSGYWGIHWRMTNQNPEVVLPNGKRQIASHYYPLIGPYDSRDPDLIDYHLLLMKYAGIDGILIDWYGSYDILDYGTNLQNTNAIIEGAKRTGLGFAVVYEDNTTEEVAKRKPVTAVQAAQADMKYAKANYFNSELYLVINNKPFLLTFGPRFFTSPSQWEQIFTDAVITPAFFPLWNHSHRTGPTYTTGEFSWVDFNASLSELTQFYQGSTPAVKIGSAYPGFHDFYAQGGWGDSYGFVDHNNGITLNKTLTLAKSNALPYLQLVTWNDFGEGTMIEPTEEFQYQYLEMLQEFSGVSYDKSVLETIHTYYVKRKELQGDTSAQQTLDAVFKKLNALEVSEANALLETI